MASHVPHRRMDEESEIDLTPMLDVVFIMLIFFIVTASFVKEAGIEVTRPDSTENDTESESKNMLFQVTASNEIWFDGRRIDVRSVRANIERGHAENPEASVVIRAHNNSDTATFTAITDAAREAGIYGVSLATTDQ